MPALVDRPRKGPSLEVVPAATETTNGDGGSKTTPIAARKITPDGKTATSLANSVVSKWRLRALIGSCWLLAIACLARTASLLAFTVAPNTVINWLMDTKDFDDGAFWLVADPDVAVMVVGSLGIGLVGLGVVYALVKLVTGFTPRQLTHAPSRRASSRTESIVRSFQFAKDRLNKSRSIQATMNVTIKGVDFVVHTLFLSQLLEGGMPVELVGLFAAIHVLNAVATAGLIAYNGGLALDLFDIFVDMLVAVVYPAAVLGYCQSTFSFDTALMAINIKHFGPSSFERIGAIASDPVQTNLVRDSLNLLRMRSWLDVVTRVGVNASLAFRCVSLARIVDDVRHNRATPPRVFRYRRMIIAACMLLAVAVVVVTERSVASAKQACEAYPQCVQVAHHWTTSDQCPCLAIVDQELFIRSYEQWSEPQDVTNVVAALAGAGYLHTVQLVNRALPQLPDEMRACTNMRRLSLMYTNTYELPSWIGEYTALEFLHVEAKLNSTNSLSSLPSDIFDDMGRLTFMHLGLLTLQRLPPMDGLRNLKAITLALLLQLEQLPSFDSLVSLEKLALVYAPALHTIPDLAATRKLKSIVTSDRGAFCCNGFLGGRCNTTDPQCVKHPRWGHPAATCLGPEQQATPATLAAFSRAIQAQTACRGTMPSRQLVVVPDESMMHECQGIMFKQCSAPGVKGASLCYNRRWTAISCEPSPAFVIAMRKDQIAQGLGLPCDPVHEAWLGCKSSIAP